MKLYTTITIMMISLLHGYGQRELLITELESDNAAVIEITGENPNASDHKEMILGFNQSNDGWLRTTTPHDLSFWTNNVKRMTVASNGNIGIGKDDPFTKLDVAGNLNVDGNLTQRGSGNTIIESTSASVTIKTAAASILIDNQGNITITGGNNLSLSADGDISISADNIEISAANDFNMVAGGDFSTQAGRNHQQTVSQSFASNVGLNQSFSALSSSFSVTNNSSWVVGNSFSLNATSMTINTSGITQLDALRIHLNGSAKGVARLSDLIFAPQGGGVGSITSASNTVLIGN